MTTSGMARQRCLRRWKSPPERSSRRIQNAVAVLSFSTSWTASPRLFRTESFTSSSTASRGIFIPGGCSYLIRADVFNQVGMFDADFFIYSDDADLAWRLGIAGYKAAGIFEAKLHHRGAAGVNPAGGIETVEFRTTDKKRFLTNRNSML